MKKSALTLALSLAFVSVASAAAETPNNPNVVDLTKHYTNADVSSLTSPIVLGWAKATADATLVNAANNTLSFANDVVLENHNIWGAYATYDKEQFAPATIQALNNKVIFDGTVTGGKTIVGAQGTGSTKTDNVIVNGNNITFQSNAKVTKDHIAGGITQIYNGQGQANNNSVIIEKAAEGQLIKTKILDGAVLYIGDEEVAIAQDALPVANVHNNHIDITGNVESTLISAGNVSLRNKDKAPLAQKYEIHASGNTVTIRSGAVVKNAEITGAFVESQLSDGKNIYATLTNNTIIVERGADVSQAKILVGAQIYDKAVTNGDLPDNGHLQFANNTLVLEGRHTIQQAKNFQSVLVSLDDEDFKSKEDTAAVVFNNHDFNEEKTAISVDVTTADLKDKKLISLGEKANELNLRVTSGFTDVNGVFDETGIFVANGSVTGAKESSILTSAMAANATFLQQGTDLLLGHDFKDGAFVALGGGKTEYDVADLSVDGFNTAFGYSFGWDSAKGDRMNVAAFVEYADGSYDATNGAKAEGDTSYYGVGLFGRHAFQNGFTGTMSVRFGRADGDFSSFMMNDAVKFDTESNYVTAHIGGEYAVKLSDNLTVSPFAQYRFARLGSDNVSAKGYNVELESFTSHRTLLGAAMSGNLSSAANYRVSLAWEHEFDGEGKARQNGVALQTLDLGGDAAVIDASVHCAPSTMQGWDFGVGIQGRVGDSDGIAGRFTTTYKF